jgi:glycosyltransferase involved in cell wall biosynthesis
MQNPELTIIMLSFNQAAYIDQAVESLLAQTFTRFELIIIDDGSTDGSQQRIQLFRDERIKVVMQKENRGIVYCRNLGLEMAKSPFIAFFDADDVAHPDKFMKQIAFLKQRPDFVMVGSAVHLTNETGARFGRWRLRFPSHTMVKEMVFRNCFVNSAVVFRREALNGFRFPEMLVTGEDYLLFWHLLKWGKGVNINQFLVEYRRHKQSIMHLLAGDVPTHDQVLYAMILKDIGIEATKSELGLHLALKNNAPIPSLPIIRATGNWLIKTGSALVSLPGISTQGTCRVIIHRWMKVCSKCRHNPLLFTLAFFNISFYFKLLKISLNNNHQHKQKPTTHEREERF